jgi:hypothetical protein
MQGVQEQVPGPWQPGPVVMRSVFVFLLVLVTLALLACLAMPVVGLYRVLRS